MPADVKLSTPCVRVEAKDYILYRNISAEPLNYYSPVCLEYTSNSKCDIDGPEVTSA